MGSSNDETPQKGFFRKIGESLGLVPAETTEGFPLPYGLTEGQYSSLKKLVASEEWQVYRQTLDRLTTFKGEALLAEKDSERMQTLRGMILGIRLAGELVDEIRLKEQDFERQRSRRADAGRSAAERNGALFGTAAWGSRDK